MRLGTPARLAPGGTLARLARTSPESGRCGVLPARRTAGRPAQSLDGPASDATGD